MLWLVLLGGMQILGFGFTLARLVFDEWQQRRASRRAPKAMEGYLNQMEYASWSMLLNRDSDRC